MDRTEIIDRITPIARDAFGMDDLVITDDLNANAVETWTSLTFMMFLQGVEKEFDIKFKVSELIRFQNMGAIIDSILR